MRVKIKGEEDKRNLEYKVNKLCINNESLDNMYKELKVSYDQMNKTRNNDKIDNQQFYNKFDFVEDK